MENLPNEILDTIFCNLPPETLFECHNVCKTWRHIIIQRFWAPQLLSCAEKDYYLEQHFILAGWHKDISDDDLIRNLYLKLTLGLQWRWRNADPIVDEHLLQRCIPESFHTDKVTAFITYKDKIFLSLANGNIQRVVHNVIPSASNTSISLQEQRVPLTSETIQNAYRQVNDESHILGSCPLVITGENQNILVSVEPRHRQKLLLWDADTEMSIGELSIPTELGVQRRIYDLAATETHIICLASWSLIVWNVPSCISKDINSIKPLVLHDFESVQEFQNWLECHTVEMNYLYVVTLATRIRFPPNNGGSRSESFINIRKFISNPCKKEISELDFDKNIQHPFPTRGKNSRVDIDRIKLSPTKHLLAVLQVERTPRSEAEDNDEVSDDDSSDSFFSHFRGYVYAVRIFDIAKGGELIYTLPISSSIFSMVRVPVQWLAPSPSDSRAHGCRAILGGSEKLFFKYVPKPDCIEEVQLGVWDSSTQETSTVKSVRLFASSDLLNITYSRITHLYNRFPSAQSYETYVGDLNLIDESDAHDLMNDNRVPIPPESSRPINPLQADIAVPEFQVRAAFYDFWD